MRLREARRQRGGVGPRRMRGLSTPIYGSSGVCWVTVAN
jgi:hypothetical protein